MDFSKPKQSGSSWVVFEQLYPECRGRKRYSFDNYSDAARFYNSKLADHVERVIVKIINAKPSQPIEVNKAKMEFINKNGVDSKEPSTRLYHNLKDVVTNAPETLSIITIIGVIEKLKTDLISKLQMDL